MTADEPARRWWPSTRRRRDGRGRAADGRRPTGRRCPARWSVGVGPRSAGPPGGSGRAAGRRRDRHGLVAGRASHAPGARPDGLSAPGGSGPHPGGPGVEGHAGHPLQRLRLLHPLGLEPGQRLQPHRRPPTASATRQGATYGAWPLIVGTLQSSFIALLLAVPVGVGTALIVVEKLPARLSNAVGFFLEVLAGIPSVVYGLWGALTLGPFLAHARGPARGQRHAQRPRPRLLPGRGAPQQRRQRQRPARHRGGAGHHDPAHHRRHHPGPAPPGAPGHGRGGGGAGDDRHRSGPGRHHALGPGRGHRGVGPRSGPGPGRDDRRGHVERRDHRARPPPLSTGP